MKTSTVTLDDDELKSWFGFGVAGNFAGHLEQAGEAVDFVNVASEGTAPKGIFPWYAPGSDTFLGEYPLSHDAITLPASDVPLNLQIEPEVGLACEGKWQGDPVVSLQPFALGAFNDCSIRRPDALKISHKKNWGPASKGVAAQFFDIGDLTPDGPTSTLRLVCHLRTADGQEHEYGVDSPLLGFKGASRADFRWDAARYTALGESTFLQPGDQAIVRVYDTESEAFSELRQTVSS